MDADTVLDMVARALADNLGIAQAVWHGLPVDLTRWIAARACLAQQDLAETMTRHCSATLPVAALAMTRYPLWRIGRLRQH